MLHKLMTESVIFDVWSHSVGTTRVEQTRRSPELDKVLHLPPQKKTIACLSDIYVALKPCLDQRPRIYFSVCGPVIFLASDESKPVSVPPEKVWET